MPDDWTRERLQRYIDDQVQEDLNLDYKGADALGKSEGKKKEIHKDVSAMANSAGGVLVYGIREYGGERSHLPERLDPVDQLVFTREWLEQVISGIQPRIQGLVITPVSIGPAPNDTAFVVEVPASSTAHQAGDYRYYKRYNFASVPMNDYEVRDVMNRSTHALIDLEITLDLERRMVTQETMGWKKSSSLASSMEPTTITEEQEEMHATLQVYARNNGAVYAQYVVAYLYIPAQALEENNDEPDEYGRARVRIDNNQSVSSSVRSWQTYNVPVLPGVREHLDDISLAWFYATDRRRDAEIKWEVFADNAQAKRGKITFGELQAGVQIRQTTESRGPFDQ